VVLGFLDGPFHVEILPVGQQWRLRLVDRTGKGGDTGTCNANPSQVRKAIAEAARRTLNACARNEWWSPDLDSMGALSESVLAHDVESGDP
jgi:hypothetical protein